MGAGAHPKMAEFGDFELKVVSIEPGVELKEHRALPIAEGERIGV